MRWSPLHCDVIIIGGGPAGLSAATWLGRHRRRTLVIDAEEGRNRWVEHVHGHLGHDPIAPNELRRIALEDLGAYPDVSHRSGWVDEAAQNEDGVFEVRIDGDVLQTRRVVLATGVRDVFPDVDGFFDHYGRSVFHCPTCDGFEAQNEKVAVIGWGPQVPAFALELLDWAQEVHVLTDGRDLPASGTDREVLARHGVEIHEEGASALLGERGALFGVRLEGGGVVDCSMAFFTIQHEPVNGLAEQLGCELDPDGYVLVNDMGLTSIPGVYAAGDLTPGMQLVPIAAAKGTVAGVAAAMSLRGEHLTGPAPAPQPAQELDDTS